MSARDLKDLAPHGKYLEWITNVKVQKHGLDGTFFVHVFLGEFNRDDPLAWRSDPNLVGTFSILGETVGTGCKKCDKDREEQLQITGQVPLTLALAERYLAGQIENLTPEKVVPYLQTNLHWRVAAVSTLIHPALAGFASTFNPFWYFHSSQFQLQLFTAVMIPSRTLVNYRLQIGQRRRACSWRSSRSCCLGDQQRSYRSHGR